MMYKDEILLISDENGDEKEYAILVTFDIESKNRSYVLYTDYTKDEEQNLKIFASIYDEKWNLSPLVDSDEIEFINNYIKELEADIKDGVYFA